VFPVNVHGDVAKILCSLFWCRLWWL
jgi:hypothetical protein